MVETEEPKQMDLLAQADAKAERLEKALARAEEILKENQAIETRRILGGQTQVSPPVEKELTAKEYKDMVMRGEFNVRK